MKRHACNRLRMAAIEGRLRERNRLRAFHDPRPYFVHTGKTYRAVYVP